jgi:hypothetical protein
MHSLGKAVHDALARLVQRDGETNLFGEQGFQRLAWRESAPGDLVGT